jgi:hypothetical protein
MTPCGCYCPLRKHCRAQPLTLQAAAGLQVQAGEGGGCCQWCQVSIHQVGQAPQAEAAQAAQLRQHLGVVEASTQQGRTMSVVLCCTHWWALSSVLASRDAPAFASSKVDKFGAT